MQMDILPTADGTPVVFHDINMKRATGLDEDIRKASLLHLLLNFCLQGQIASTDDMHMGIADLMRQPEHARCLQVPTSQLPHYRDVLDPLLPLDGAKPVHTKDFKDGQRIPTLAELLEAVRMGHTACLAL